MKIELVDINPVKKSLAIEADADEVVRETAAVVRRWASQVKVPGFRQGKVPTELVRKRFSKEIEEDVRERLVSRLYAEAAREKGLRPLGDPVLDELTAEPGQPFRFKTTFEVLPTLEVKSYTGVEVREAPAVVGDADVDEALESLRQAHTRYVVEEGRASETGDLVVADLVETIEGGEEKSRERAVIEVGAPDHLPAFNEQLHGVSAGRELDFTVRYPDEFPAARLAGKDVRYRFRVHEVKRRELPEVDDAFAKDMGEFESLDALKGRIRADLEERKRREARGALRQSILDKVLLENPVALPEILVDEEIRHRLEDMVRGMMYQGLDPRSVELDWKAARDRQEEPARKTVHARLVLDAVARKEGLSVSPEELDRRIVEEASRIGEDAEELGKRLRKSDGVQALEIQMVREKALDFLTSSANISTAE